MENKKKALPFLLLAIGLLCVSSILATTSFLRDSTSYSSSFKIVTGDSLDIEFIAPTKTYTNETMLAEQSLSLTPTLKNNGVFNAYVFAEVAHDQSIVIDGDFDANWSFFDSPDDNTTIYYFGDSEGPSQFTPGTTSTLFDSVTVYDDGQEESTLTINVYAIQSAGLDGKTAIEIWSEIK